MNTIFLNTNHNYRKVIYLLMLVLAAFVLGVYFRGNYPMLIIGSILIGLSIFLETTSSASKNITAIIIDDEYPNTISICIDNKQSDFWDIKRSIIINNWIYVFLIQQGSSKKIKTWLYKSNFKDTQEIRLLARKIHFINSNH